MKHLGHLLVVLVVACSGSSTSSPGPASGSQTQVPTPPKPEPTTEPAAVDPAQLGQQCGDGGTCAPPMECVKYYGIAGARGPQFATCEIPCSEKSTCPANTACTTIADGPGAVCRPR